MTISSRVSLALLTALLPLTAVAADTPSVSGIHAEQKDGKVVVSWTPVEGDIKKYRIFYSHASILEQGGVYDDYEDAAGDASDYTLSSVPPVTTLYVSVLAVSQDDVESPLFLEEAKVELTPSRPGTVTPTAAVAAFPPSPTVPMESSTLQLLTAISTSSTGVVLSFTHPLSIPEQFKAQAFAIKSGSGIELRVVRYRLEGTYAILDTAPQTPGRVYQVTIHGSLAGKTPAGELVPQEESTAPLLFTGLQTDPSVPEVQNLKVVAKGNNTVEATWTAPAGTLRELQVQQSTNGGRTFGVAVRIDKASKGITIPGVDAQQFTLLVRVVSADGSVSRGVQQTVTLGTVQASSSSKTGASSSKSSVSSKPVVVKPGTKPTTLPSSGLGLVTIMTLSGAATGMRIVRKKNVPVA